MSFFAEFAEHLSDPLVLIGFALMILFLIFKRSIKVSGKSTRKKIIYKFINLVSIIIGLLILVGFGYKFYSTDDKYSEDLSESITFSEIPDLEQKIKSFHFNIPDQDTLKLIFESKKWNLKTPIIISKNYKVSDLKNALINHFELRKTIDARNREVLIENWVLIANRRDIEDETKTLVDAGINNGDLIQLKIYGYIYEVFKTSGEDPEIELNPDDE